MEALELRFTVSEGRTVLTGGGRTACAVQFDGNLRAEFFYNFSPEPLVLSADAKAGDQASIRVSPLWIAMYVNGALADEEWPCGNGYLSPACSQSGDLPVEIAPSGPDADCRQPEALRLNIPTGLIRRPGVNIGDCMPYSDAEGGDGRYHLFYLYDRHHHKSKWHLGAHQWAHVSTKDLKTWDEHPMAVKLTQGWEGSICTGSVIRAGGRWYAWYAVRMADRSPARLTYAVSDDLEHFEKCGAYFHVPEGYEPTGARDPFLFFWENKYHMLVTTRTLDGDSGCLAHLVNDAMGISGWRNAGPIMRWHDHCAPDSPERRHTPECADWFRMGGYYYLVFGIGSVSRYMYSKKTFGPWTYPEGALIPCGCVPKSAVLPGAGRRIFMGFRGEGGYAGSLCAAEALQNEDGTLRFEPVLLE